MSVGLGPILILIFFLLRFTINIIIIPSSFAVLTSFVTKVCACDFVLVAALFLAPQSLDSGMSSHTHTFQDNLLSKTLRLSV